MVWWVFGLYMDIGYVAEYGMVSDGGESTGLHQGGGGGEISDDSLK